VSWGFGVLSLFFNWFMSLNIWLVISVEGPSSSEGPKKHG
jgi:hypothetical protein